ncbi:MAG: DUF2946 family protein [Noviherbaspirillum sp.]
MASVKKLLLILLLTILPLQYSWAAAAVYCQHGQEHAAHFGHHSHHHDGQPGKSDGDGQGGLKQFHSDCEVCHFFGQAPLAAAMPVVGLPEPPVFRAPPHDRFTSHVEEGPRRPDRRLVA